MLAMSARQTSNLSLGPSRAAQAVFLRVQTSKHK